MQQKIWLHGNSMSLLFGATPALCVVWEPRRLQVVVKERTSLDPCMIPPISEYLTFPQASYFYVQCTVYRVQCAPHSVHHTVCSVQCTNTVKPVLCPPWCSIHHWLLTPSGRCPHCTAQCTMHTAHCTLCRVHCAHCSAKYKTLL